MPRRSLEWPKLIGSVLALEALGIFLIQARLLFWSSANSGWPDPLSTWLWLLFATSLCLLAYFVYRAHNWARRIVIGLFVCLGAFALFMPILKEVGEREHARSHSEEWPLASQVESALSSFGMSFSAFLAPIAFIIGTLWHRDVAASFRAPTTERSNQTMQRTPTRRSPDISDD